MATYPPDLESYIDEKIRSGKFHSRDDFATEAARLYRDIEEHHARLKADVNAALVQVHLGQSEPLDIEAIQRELVAELDEQGQPH